MVRLFSGATVMRNCRMRSDAVSMVAWVPFRYGPVEAMGFVDTFSIAYSVFAARPEFWGGSLPPRTCVLYPQAYAYCCIILCINVDNF